MSEIARFEQTLLFAFDAQDSSLGKVKTLNQIDIYEWPNIKIRFHPSTQLFQSHYNCVEIWQALKHKNTPPNVHKQKDVYWLVWRNSARITEFRSIKAAEYESIQVFLDGGTLSGACEQLLSHHAENEVSRVVVNYLLGWLNSNLVSSIVTQ